MGSYACIECLLKSNCSDICPEVSSHKVFNSMIRTGRCPDCEGKEIKVHQVTGKFWIVQCCTCRSRFTLDFRYRSLMINRSSTPKGDIGDLNGRIVSFTTTTYSAFLGREGYGLY